MRNFENIVVNDEKYVWILVNNELAKISRGGYKSIRKNYNICLKADFYADVA